MSDQMYTPEPSTRTKTIDKREIVIRFKSSVERDSNRVDYYVSGNVIPGEIVRAQCDGNGLIFYPSVDFHPAVDFIPTKDGWLVRLSHPSLASKPGCISCCIPQDLIAGMTLKHDMTMTIDF